MKAAAEIKFGSDIRYREIDKLKHRQQRNY